MCAWLDKKFELRMELFFDPAESHRLSPISASSRYQAVLGHVL
jgi:hypothetical protein